MTRNNKKVGYGNPPQEKQFQKGKSGNPKGRPKGAKKQGVLDIIEKALGEKVTLSDDTKITKMSAMITGMANDAVRGDFSAPIKSIPISEISRQW